MNLCENEEYVTSSQQELVSFRETNCDTEAVINRSRGKTTVT